MLNKIILMGRLTYNPEIRYTNETNVLNFNIAVQRDRKDMNGEYQADFFSCVAWAQKADFIQKYFGKGDLIIIIGRLQSRSWADENGNNRTKIEILVEEVQFSGAKKNNILNDDDFDKIPF